MDAKDIKGKKLIDTNSDFFDLELISKAISCSEIIFSDDIKRDFNNAFKHIFNLLKDSAILYLRNSYPTSLFLSITAIEEVSKAEMGLFQGKNGVRLKRSKDPLFSHKKKHKISLVDTVIMSERILQALGSDRCNELLQTAHDGGFTSLREQCLYFYTDNNNVFKTPLMLIDKKTVKDILLLSIECFDDRLIGYSDYSLTVWKEVDELFEEVLRK